MKKKLFTLLQLVIGFAILGVIFWNLNRTGELTKLVQAVQTARGNWPMLALSLVGIGFSLLLCTLRWDLLLKAQDVHLPLPRLFTLYLIGQFFSAFMLGATGGDLVKAYYVATETKHKRTEVVTTVFFDRVVGLMALIGLVVAVMLVRLRFFLAHPRMHLAILFNSALLAGTVIGLLVVFRRNLFEQWGFFRRLEEKTALGEIIGRVYASMRFCLSHRGLLSKTLLLSFLNHMTVVVWGYYLAMALGIDNGFVAMLTVVPLINAVSALPITPGGLGTRDGAAIFLLGVIGVSAATAVTFSLLSYAAILTWSIFGGVLYLGYSVRRGRVPSPP